MQKLFWNVFIFKNKETKVKNKLATTKIPSKTFFLGEYGVLKNSPSLIIGSAPYFEAQSSSEWSGFGSGPIQNFIKDFKLNPCSFQDPWKGAGGFGASSAQFAFLYQQLEPQLNLAATTVDKLLTLYRKYFATPVGLPPSGHDVIAQLLGKGLCFVDVSRGIFKKIENNLNEHDILVLKTNSKVPTHAHLSTLEDIHFDLREIVEQAAEGFSSGNLLQVVSAIEEQNRILMEQGLVLDETLALRQKLEEIPGIVITKGCGALGADTLLMVCESDSSAQILESVSNSFIALKSSYTPA